MESNENIHSEKIKAGKRTYFFDIKETRDNCFYLVFTESRKTFNEDGTFTFQRNKVFVYPEDIKRVAEAFNNSTNKIKELMPNFDFDKFEGRNEE